MAPHKKKKKSFEYRVAAVVIAQGRVLLRRVEQEDFWSLPGGYVQPMEMAASAVEREAKAALGVPVEVTRLVWLVEHFFKTLRQKQSALNASLPITGRKIRVHEVCLYFLASLPAGSALVGENGPFPGRADTGSPRHVYQWFPLETAALDEVNLLPAFLRQALLDIPSDITHIVLQRKAKGY